MSIPTRAANFLRLVGSGRDDAADAAGRFGHMAQREYKDLSDLLSRFARDLADMAARNVRSVDAEAMLGDASRMARQGASDVTKILRSEVRSRPLQTLLLVAAAGIIIGWLGKRSD